MGFKVLGTGSYVPERIVTNDELSQMVETSDEWIVQRVGVRERHVSVDETTADMGIRAAARALEASGIKAEELGLIVTATCTGDSLCPSTAALIQRGIGASCPAFDVNSACSGFLFALETAAALMEKNHLNMSSCSARSISPVSSTGMTAPPASSSATAPALPCSARVRAILLPASLHRAMTKCSPSPQARAILPSIPARRPPIRSI